MKKTKKVNIDRDEKEILTAYDNDEFSTADNVADLKISFQKAAKNTLVKNANINLRLPESDIIKIKQKAEESGIPYQTLIGALIHQFAEGKIKLNI